VHFFIVIIIIVVVSIVVFGAKTAFPISKSVDQRRCLRAWLADISYRSVANAAQQRRLGSISTIFRLPRVGYCGRWRGSGWLGIYRVSRRKVGSV
jgi:hypothetical protein